MDSNSSDVFLELIHKITTATGKTEPEIAVMVGRNKGYISQLKSRMKNGNEVPASFIELLKLRFANVLNTKIVINGTLKTEGEKPASSVTEDLVREVTKSFPALVSLLTEQHKTIQSQVEHIRFLSERPPDIGHTANTKNA